MKFLHSQSHLVVVCLMIVIFVAICTGCSKKKREQSLASTYFKMAMLELSAAPDDHNTRKKAVVLIDKALQEHEKAEYLALRGTLLFQLGLYDESERCFKRGLMLEKGRALSAEITNNYACLLAQKGFIEQAEVLWNTIRNDPNYQTPEVALVNLGKVAMQRHNFIAAQRFFGDAIYISPSYVDAHLYLGLAAVRSGDKKLARNELETVLSLEPEHGIAKAALVQIESRI